jgi:hypothetical protein
MIENGYSKYLFIVFAVGACLQVFAQKKEAKTQHIILKEGIKKSDSIFIFPPFVNIVKIKSHKEYKTLKDSVYYISPNLSEMKTDEQKYYSKEVYACYNNYFKPEKTLKVTVSEKDNQIIYEELRKIKQKFVDSSFVKFPLSNSLLLSTLSKYSSHLCVLTDFVQCIDDDQTFTAFPTPSVGDIYRIFIVDLRKKNMLYYNCIVKFQKTTDYSFYISRKPIFGKLTPGGLYPISKLLNQIPQSE